uniref:SCP domain-containing protein n=1 Tax=Fagus sylvatica TaxID=28930 RepID=A0A2N9J664_FAGSY
MTWDANLAAFAQNYANQRKGDCRLVHSGGPYGENLAGSSGDLSGTAAVVWRNSARLGCAKVRCNNGGTFIGCNYDPRGNINGQRPY